MRGHRTQLRKDAEYFGKFSRLWLKRGSAHMASLYAIYAARCAFKMIGR